MDKVRPTVVIGLVGAKLDQGRGARRWDTWRPTVSICQHDDLLIDRFELLHERGTTSLAATLSEDIRSVSPETTVKPTVIDYPDAWDFEGVFAALHAFSRCYPFDSEREDYLLHVTTGSHVWQICLFLLTESRHLPGRLLQTSPKRTNESRSAGTYSIIDLAIARRFALRRHRRAIRA